MDLGNKLKVLRNKFNFSQQQIADKIGISKSKYCRVEKGEALLNTEEIQKLFQVYCISSDEFFQLKFPLENVIDYPKEKIKKLEEVVETNNTIGNTWTDNLKRLNELRDAAIPLLKIREEKCNFPELNLKNIDSGTTVKSLRFNVRDEALITKCLKLQEEYLDWLFGGHNN